MLWGPGSSSYVRQGVPCTINSFSTGNCVTYRIICKMGPPPAGMIFTQPWDEFPTQCSSKWGEGGTTKMATLEIPRRDVPIDTSLGRTLCRETQLGKIVRGVVLSYAVYTWYTWYAVCFVQKMNQTDTLPISYLVNAVSF